MDQELLVSEAIEHGAELVRRFHEFEPVYVAFWLNDSERNKNDLYIATVKTDVDSSVGYGEIVRIRRELRSPWLGTFRVRSIDSKNPLAVEAHAYISLYPGRSSLQFGARSFGGKEVESVYIYAPPEPATV